jgi:hypothetical protein
MSSQPLYSLNSIHSVNADFCNMIGPWNPGYIQGLQVIIFVASKKTP